MSRRLQLFAAAAAALALLAACRGGADASAVPPSGALSSGAVVDTVHAMEEEFRRFTADLGERPTELDGGAASLDALARQFVAAVSARDTAALGRMHVTRPEFAHLYWLGSPVSRPPYEMPPGLLWFQLEGGSATGVRRLLAEYGGRALKLESVQCPGGTRDETNGTVSHLDCTVTLRVDGERRTQELFGNVVERGGRFKFLSYANDF